MRGLVVVWLFLGLLSAQTLLKGKVKDDSFITILEYGKELYKNPRDISCARCHAPLGEQRIITHYRQHGKERIFKAPPIYNLPFERFKNALERGRSIMPRYNLTLDEIKAIYYYITSVRDNKQN
ncbi:c-type cytochrome [Helicobacter cynogastricus]|uniref:c-type cytochrome n=1 Tax=Helicobacter cynogastricus TaxID=329937 RepID=UPI0018F813F0|nr:cytochrome c [Helicobacter cynogastricus]